MDDYNKDPRTVCKYGANCYRKNATHKAKFKHPPRDEPEEASQSPKRFKKDDSEPEEVNKDNTVEEKISKGESSNEAPRSPTGRKEKEQPLKEKDNKLSEVEETDQSENDEDEDELPLSPTDKKLSIKQKFLVEMPDDFFSFWNFCKSLSKDKPEEALKDVGLQLVGPYEVLSGKISRSAARRTQSRFLRHWRFYYDPPELQTVVVKNDSSLYHIGYFRDDPKEMPCFLASNCASKDGILTPMGPNIFSCVNTFLEEKKKSIDPFGKIKVSKLQKSLQAWAEKEKISLNNTSSEMKQRSRKTVCKTFHGAGLVVPYNKKSDVGYRPLIESNVNLKQILGRVMSAETEKQREDAMEELHPIINAANIANDECDFGTSVELGLDLFSTGGKDLTREAYHLLTVGYKLLNRPQFFAIVKAHLKHRRKGDNVDMFP